MLRDEGIPKLFFDLFSRTNDDTSAATTNDNNNDNDTATTTITNNEHDHDNTDTTVIAHVLLARCAVVAAGM